MTTDASGKSGLMQAAENGHAQLVTLLRSHENCVQNDEGMSALMFAAATNHRDCVMLLMPYEMGLRDAACRMAIDHASSNLIRELLWIERKRDQYQMR